ncbi:MAG: GNAT family N-acetyltransferase [Microbacteriaceae bacterium]
MSTVPAPADLPAITRTLAGWQHDGSPIQLHPGDLGWAWQAGAAALARNVRTWSADSRIVAIGLLDGPDLIRMAIDPDFSDDPSLASRIVADLTAPDRGVLPAGTATAEARFGAALRNQLRQEGWDADEPWTPLVRDLSQPVPDSGVRIVEVTTELARARVDLQNAAFGSASFTEERRLAASRSAAFANARDLIAFDGQNTAVAMVTVWSAGVAKPGVLEPMGVHPDHRGHGYGRAISLAAAAALRDLGASQATVCTPSENVGAVATYASAGFDVMPEETDFLRPL